jgi:hypothetical protein
VIGIYFPSFAATNIFRDNVRKDIYAGVRIIVPRSSFSDYFQVGREESIRPLHFQCEK